MGSPEAVRAEIEQLTADLISVGLCVDQNFPSMNVGKGGEIIVGFSETESLSITLKNIPYSDAYDELSKSRAYNMKLIDGALLQIMYLFSERRELLRHRLAFFPAPDLLEYQNNAEIYEQDEIYIDIIEKSVVTTPLRFDFDKQNFVDYHHPMSHFTLGQYKNCRIPVSGPLNPFLFVHFILRSFYNTPFQKYCAKIREFQGGFEHTITALEKRHLHVSTPVSAGVPASGTGSDAETFARRKSSRRKRA
jgi:hypothetical protein